MILMDLSQQRMACIKTILPKHAEKKLLQETVSANRGAKQLFCLARAKNHMLIIQKA